jgi:hypothetical protein
VVLVRVHGVQQQPELVVGGVGHDGRLQLGEQFRIGVGTAPVQPGHAGVGHAGHGDPGSRGVEQVVVDHVPRLGEHGRVAQAQRGEIDYAVE